MGENGLKWFGYVDRRNNDEIVKNIGKKGVEENRGGVG